MIVQLRFYCTVVGGRIEGWILNPAVVFVGAHHHELFAVLPGDVSGGDHFRIKGRKAKGLGSSLEEELVGEDRLPELHTIIEPGSEDRRFETEDRLGSCSQTSQALSSDVFLLLDDPSILGVGLVLYKRKVGF